MELLVTALPGFQSEAQVGKICVKEGQTAAKGDVILTLEGGKGGVEVTAPEDLCIEKYEVCEGDTVKMGDVLAKMQPQAAAAETGVTVCADEMPGFAAEAAVGAIAKAEGESVNEGDVILTLEGGKGAVEVKAACTGVMTKLFVHEGDTVEKGAKLAEICCKEQNAAKECIITADEMPGFAAEAAVGAITKAEGESVNEGDVILTLEGGKGAVEVKAACTGVVTKLFVHEGDTVEKGAKLAAVSCEKAAGEKPEKTAKPEKQYHGEVVVLGGGPGGYVAAIRASQRGKKTILIEADQLGGTCLNRGCIPTKSMVQSTRVLDTIRKADIFGMMDAGCRVEMEKIIDRKQQVVGTLVSGLNASMKRHDITVLRGRGIARDAHSLEVALPDETAVVTFDDLILAPGSVVSYPPFEGADLPDNLTSDDLLELREIPESLIIMGGRVIAMEFAFIYRKLGCDVTVIQRSDSIFPNMDDDVIKEVRDSALAAGIKLYEGTKTHAIRSTADGKKLVEFEHQGVTKYLTAEKLAVATGRKPNLDGLHLDRLNVEISEKTHGIRVDSHMKTTADHIYAIGDATNLYDLAHVASKQGLVAVENIMGNPVEMRYDAIPEAVFTAPEIGVCGKTEKTCAKEGIEILVGKFPYMSNGKALVEDATEGFIKVIARKADRKIIGAALCGISAADLMSAFANLITIGATIDQAKEVVYAHPTVSETLMEAVMDLDGESIHK